MDSPAGSAECASKWIAESARWIERQFHPTLNLVYLPHLDYGLQRLGPGHPGITADLRLIDDLAGGLIDFFEAQAVRVVVLSEYGISPVDHPIHLNRLFRAQGWLAVKEELGAEILDCGASRVFAVADHQVAHVYLNDSSLGTSVRALLEAQTGIAEVLGPAEKREAGIEHPRAGDLIVVAGKRAWFTYYYWMEDRRAPDFARTVDIHRKPGYDPVELFLDPQIRLPKLKIGWRLLQKRLGFRMLMDVVPLEATLVRGSHGRRPVETGEWPLLMSSCAGLVPAACLKSTEVCAVLRNHVLE